MNPWLELALATVVILIVWNVAMILVGAVLRVPINEAGLFFGPTLFRFEFRGVTYKLKLVPLGGYVDFRHPEFEEAPLRVAIPTMAAGCVAAMLIAVACLPPQEAFHRFVDTYRQLIVGAYSPRQGADFLHAAYEYVRSHEFVDVLGAVAAKFSALNLLPFPTLIGGQILLRIVDRFSTKGNLIAGIMNGLTFLCLFPLLIGWGYAWYLALTH